MADDLCGARVQCGARRRVAQGEGELRPCRVWAEGGAPHGPQQARLGGVARRAPRDVRRRDAPAALQQGAQHSARGVGRDEVLRRAAALRVEPRVAGARLHAEHHVVERHRLGGDGGGGGG
eukprot:scaffold34965_cov68-Phaeocystis_antarctica.AAC.1